VCGLSREEVDDIRLAAGEAIGNAVEHGSASRSRGFSVRCSFVDDELTIEIRDDGDGFDPSETYEPSPGRPHGYGIFLMQRLMDTVAFEKDGTCVRLRRRRKLAPN
jgi:anti-sigma regulatory factor (Ser/Thr protein kinase)